MGWILWLFLNKECHNLRKLNYENNNICNLFTITIKDGVVDLNIIINSDLYKYFGNIGINYYYQF